MTRRIPTTLRAVVSAAVLISLLAAASAEAQGNRCCFNNRRYTGTCEVVPGTGRDCASVLEYLNSTMSVGGAFCDHTPIRMGWTKVSCTGTQSTSGTHVEPGQYRPEQPTEAPGDIQAAPATGLSRQPSSTYPTQPLQAPGAIQPVTMPAGTILQVSLDHPVDEDDIGQPFSAHLTSAAISQGAIIAPSGSMVHGRLAQPDPAVAGTDFGAMLEITEMTIDDERRTIVGASGQKTSFGVSIPSEADVLEQGQIVALGPTTPLLPVGEAIELTRSAIQGQRQAIVAANMLLSTEESLEFWPLYREYRHAVAAINDRSVALITGYADAYDDLSDTYAQSMLDEILAIERDQNRLKRQYVKKFRKALPPKAVTRFFQVENRLDAIIYSELASDIPLVR